jgi:hypothetical protein
MSGVADEMHSPTTAGPTPDPAGAAAYSPPPTASPSSPVERPEVQAGAAFAGGFIAALILKRLVR